MERKITPIGTLNEEGLVSRIKGHQISTGEVVQDLYRLGQFESKGREETLELIRLYPGVTYPAHIHHHADARIYVIEGIGDIILGDEILPYSPGKLFEASRKTPHGFMPREDTLFLSMHSPAILNLKTGEIDFEFKEE